jgi:hypothetical protein
VDLVEILSQVLLEGNLDLVGLLQGGNWTWEGSPGQGESPLAREGSLVLVLVLDAYSD